VRQSRRVSTSPDSGQPWPWQTLRRPRSGRLLLGESARKISAVARASRLVNEGKTCR
jgi:hypothetical protein